MSLPAARALSGGAVRAGLSALRERLRDRPDSEHEQAIVRLAIVGLLAAYFHALAWDSPDRGALLAARGVALAYLVLSVGYLAAIVRRPARSPVRRLTAMMTDFAALSTMLHFGADSAAPLYPIYLWITFGNGFRYGLRYLAASVAVSVAAFGTAAYFTPFWHSHVALTVGLLAGLVVLPAYVASLIRMLTEAKMQAEAANRAKSRFLAVMSHELRTPLHAITGLVGLLQGAPLRGEDRSMLGTIANSARTLLSLIDNILDFSKIEAGRVALTPVEFDLHAELAGIVAMLRPQAAESGLRLVLQVAPRVPYRLRGDVKLMRQVIVNLLANALKFTPSGEVRLAADLGGRRGGAQAVRFEVSDTGIGIPAADRDRIFESFTQVDQSTGRRFGGAGLGLTIVKQLTELMGGEIRVDSAAGHGSRFRVVLPFEALPPPEPPATLSGRVAVQSDDAEFAAALRQAIAAWGATAEFAADAVELRRRLRRNGDAQALFAILVDNRKPLAPQEAGELCALAPIILIARDSAVDEATARCCLSVVPAAAIPAQLHSALRAAHASAAHVGEAPSLPAAQRRAASLRVLVVEDNPVNRQVTKRILERGGHVVVLAGDGDEALDLLERDAVDLVLMDVNMPGTSGLDVVQLYRFARLGLPRVPIVALTADATVETRRLCEAAGMDDYITKPIGGDDLLAAIDRIMAGRSAGPATKTAEKSAPAGAPDVDRRALERLRRLGGGSEFVTGLLRDFVADAEQRVVRMAEAERTADWRAFCENAHALRSSAGNIGAAAIATRCGGLAHMERTAFEREAAAHVAALAGEIDVFRQAVRADTGAVPSP